MALGQIALGENKYVGVEAIRGAMSDDQVSKLYYNRAVCLSVTLYYNIISL